MYVKSLRLSGFKSFAEATVLDFEPGVNVIVGPNGSGKSNIADALSWVLGSQAPSTLRGESMEDVIFAGSARRPGLGVAEVSLTLDNTDGLLGLGLSEVTISRSVDRAGASEYRINGASCRLLDITELLSDTGVGRSLHTVVGQGQLDGVLEGRPEDRRAFIEEAAQIGKFRRRKDRSLRKLERVEDNLMRLNDVLLELKRAIRPLRRQAEAAAQYSELLGEHRGLKQRLSATELARLREVESHVRAELNDRRTELLGDELATVRALLERASARRSSLADDATRAQRIAHEMARATDRLDGLAKLAAERAETAEARLAAETEEGYRERIRVAQQQRSRWLAERERLSEDATEASAHAESARVRAEAARTELSEADAQLSTARTHETRAEQDLVRAEGAEAAGRASIASLHSRIHAVEERRQVAENELKNDIAALEAAERDVHSLEKQLDEATEAAAAAETELETARERADRLRDVQAMGAASLAAAEARHGAFREVLDLLGDNEDVQRVVKPLADEAAQTLGRAASDESQAGEALAEASDEVERLWVHVAGRDEDLRRLDALLSGAAEKLAGARRRKENREVEIAALDDELARAQEGLAAAETQAAEERVRLPELKASLEDARRALIAAQSRSHTLRVRVEEATSEASEAALHARTAQERELAARLRVEEAEGEIADANSALSSLASRRSALQSARDKALGVAEVAGRSAQQGRRWTAEAEERAQAATATARAEEARATELAERERALASQLTEASSERSRAEIRRTEATTRIEGIAQRAMEEWGLSLEDLDALEPFAPDDEADAQTRAAKLDREMKRLGPVNPTASDEYRALAEREEFLQKQIEDLKSSKRDLMRIVREIDETIVASFSEAFDAIAAEFEGVFGRLFPGGAGAIKLTDPSDVLGSGVEIEARPPGKNVKKLSLLSGGERSLVALAFLFSIFRARPSPFYLLDEVEAALDDINLSRFLGLVRDLRSDAQVLVVTHQKRTMEAADVLYGVTMSGDGVSRVIAKRMEEISV